MTVQSAWNMVVIVLVILAIGTFQQGFHWNPWEDGWIRTKLAFACIFSLVAWGAHATTLYHDLDRRGAWWLGVLTVLPLLLIGLYTRFFTDWSGDILAWILWLVGPAGIVFFSRKSLWQLVLGLVSKRFQRRSN